MTACFINFIVCGTAAGTDHVILMQSTVSQQLNENKHTWNLSMPFAHFCHIISTKAQILLRRPHTVAQVGYSLLSGGVPLVNALFLEKITTNHIPPNTMFFELWYISC